MKSFKTLFKTELKLSLRGMDMFIFSICMPIIAIVILGVIFGNKPAFSGANYTFFEQSFSAVSTIAICAGGVMGLPLVIADYRNKKILKRFKVTPIKPSVLLLVQLSIYALYSIVSLILLYLVSSLFFNYTMQGSVILFLGSYLLVMISIFSIGLVIGGVSPNMKMASVIASLVYFPMLIFSGATIPYEIMPQSLQSLANIFPLTQGIKFLKAASLGTSIEQVFLPVLIMIAISFICATISVKFFRWE